MPEALALPFVTGAAATSASLMPMRRASSGRSKFAIASFEVTAARFSSAMRAVSAIFTSSSSATCPADVRVVRDLEGVIREAPRSPGDARACIWSPSNCSAASLCARRTRSTVTLLQADNVDIIFSWKRTTALPVALKDNYSRGRLRPAELRTRENASAISVHVSVRCALFTHPISPSRGGPPVLLATDETCRPAAACPVPCPCPCPCPPYDDEASAGGRAAAPAVRLRALLVPSWPPPAPGWPWHAP